MAIFDSLISPVLTQVTNLISQFHASPEEKEAALEKMNQLQQQAVQDAQDYETKLNDIAGENIRAEETSTDKYTSRARPTFMYIVEAVLAGNYILIPLLQFFSDKTIQPFVLPPDLLTLFGVCVTGYVFNRTAEKISAMPGASSVNMLGILKVTQASSSK